ncbi:hypothetical protein EXIGLDRAFT_709303 [Exidia glandulosa HHB12029]|uniref:Uncharacterized protein n=1 Tax=Exidia glandulosa HHB12029 TaxID=1314781 RepID=A0A165IX00_EXIGL|nr:hypothetical protein EXIGLDRAFT_709303 [Exidia glandulosa HHB12029]
MPALMLAPAPARALASMPVPAPTPQPPSLLAQALQVSLHVQAIASKTTTPKRVQCLSKIVRQGLTGYVQLHAWYGYSRGSHTRYTERTGSIAACVTWIHANYASELGGRRLDPGPTDAQRARKAPPTLTQNLNIFKTTTRHPCEIGRTSHTMNMDSVHRSQTSTERNADPTRTASSPALNPNPKICPTVRYK